MSNIKRVSNLKQHDNKIDSCFKDEKTKQTTSEQGGKGVDIRGSQALAKIKEGL